MGPAGVRQDLRQLSFGLRVGVAEQDIVPAKKEARRPAAADNAAAHKADLEFSGHDLAP